MKLDFFARESHHTEHGMAIYKALPVEYRGVFTDKISELKSDVVATFAFGDLKLIDQLGKKIIYSEHGTGFFYNNIHPSYAGSVQHRENVILRLVPNERIAEREREVLKCPVEIIGVPKMDKYANKEFKLKEHKPVIAISFHWDCYVNPETRSAFYYYRNYFKSWRAKGWKIIGHGHPRIFKKLAIVYKSCGIMPVEDFKEVVKKADVYACDNSSSLFEFAFTKKPVVLLNCPLYRRDVQHKGNPRFWEYSDMGPQVDSPVDFVEAVENALKNRELFLPRIEQMREDIFTFTDGKCAERASEIIIKHLKKYEDKR